MEVFETTIGVKFVRTSDERFTNLSDRNYKQSILKLMG